METVTQDHLVVLTTIKRQMQREMVDLFPNFCEKQATNNNKEGLHKILESLYRFNETIKDVRGDDQINGKKDSILGKLTKDKVANSFKRKEESLIADSTKKIKKKMIIEFLFCFCFFSTRQSILQ